MLTDRTFQVCFEYYFSSKDCCTLLATITSSYTQSYYVVKNICILNHNSLERNCITEIHIKPVIDGDTIRWVHADSNRTSILCTAIGNAIEANGNLEMLTLNKEAV